MQLFDARKMATRPNDSISGVKGVCSEVFPFLSTG